MDEKELDLKSWSVEGQQTVNRNYEDPKNDNKPTQPVHKADDEPKTDPLPQSPKKGRWGWILMISLVVIAAGFLIYYFGYHDWERATCSSPSICRICGRTNGTSLGHHMLEATCTTPRTCDRCGYQEAFAPGHTWTEPTCQVPMTCIVCGQTEGNPLGHNWQEATWTEPKTCTVCGGTEGKPQRETFSVTCVLWVCDRETGRQSRRAKDPLLEEVLQDGEMIGFTPRLINNGENPCFAEITVSLDDQVIVHWNNDSPYDPGASIILAHPHKINSAGSHTYSVVVNGENVDSGSIYYSSDIEMKRLFHDLESSSFSEIHESMTKNGSHGDVMNADAMGALVKYEKVTLDNAGTLYVEKDNAGKVVKIWLEKAGYDSSYAEKMNQLLTDFYGPNRGGLSGFWNSLNGEKIIWMDANPEHNEILIQWINTEDAVLYGIP